MKKSRLRLLWRVFAFLFSLSALSQVQATLFKHEFSGTITTLKNVDFSVSDPFNGSLSIGTEFSGFYEFDPNNASEAACNTTSTNCYWEFLIPSFKFEVTVGTTTIKTPDDYKIIQQQDINNVSPDTYVVSSADYFDIGGDWVVALQISLQDSLMTAITDTTNILNPPFLADFDLRQFGIVRITDGCSGCEGMIFGNIEQISAIPEPTTLAMLSLGLAGLGLYRRKKRA